MMSISLLQGACGSKVMGPTVRIPPGNYNVEKNGVYKSAQMYLNGSEPIKLNSKIILSNHTSVRVEAEEAIDLTVRFIKEN